MSDLLDRSEERKRFLLCSIAIAELTAEQNSGNDEPGHCVTNPFSLITPISTLKGLVNVLEDTMQSGDFKQQFLDDYMANNAFNPARSILEFAFGALGDGGGCSFLENSANLHMAFETISRLLALTPLDTSAFTSAADAVIVRRFRPPIHHAELGRLCTDTEDMIKNFYDVLIDDLFRFDPTVDPRNETEYQSLVLSALFVWSSLQSLTLILLETVARRAVHFDQNRDCEQSACLVLDVTSAVTQQLRGEVGLPKADILGSQGARKSTSDSLQGGAPKPSSVKFQGALQGFKLVLPDIPTVQTKRAGPMRVGERRKMLQELELTRNHLAGTRISNAFTAPQLCSCVLELEVAVDLLATSLDTSSSLNSIDMLNRNAFNSRVAQ